MPPTPNRMLRRINVIADLSEPSIVEAPSAGDRNRRDRASLVMDDTFQYHVRMARDINDLFQVAVLRAECYYEVK